MVADFEIAADEEVDPMCSVRRTEVQVVGREGHKIAYMIYSTHTLEQRIGPKKREKAESPSHIWQFGFHCADFTTAT